ncbi:MAG: glycosyltransferase [Alphaproteobacteria bacterium]|jgi:glycosyltransferase involved in cell wall biosynthesis|nr:glycosyltransferase [Alphaproteobacteria bacterium]
MDDLISVVIPIYNVEKYLPRCLDSVINQDYKNLEIVCVNDGSPDSCADILENYKQKDDRIKIYHNKNGGLSFSRNFGVNNSSGSFIYFLDSDDYISENYISGLYSALKKSDADFSYNDKLVSVYENKNISSKNKLKLNEGSYDIKDIKWNEIRISVCNKLFKRDFFNKYSLNFAEGLMFEDHLFNIQLFHFANRISISNAGAYFYTRIGDSFSNSYYDSQEEKSFFYEIEIYRKVIEFYKKFDKLSETESFKWLYKHLVKTCDLNKDNFLKELRKLFESFNEEFMSSRSGFEVKFYNLVMNHDNEFVKKELAKNKKKKQFLKSLRNIANIIRFK